MIFIYYYLLAERVELTRVVHTDVELARVVVELELEVGGRGGRDGRGGRGGAGSGVYRFGVGDFAWVDSVYVGVVFACRGTEVEKKILGSSTSDITNISFFKLQGCSHSSNQRF